jgi:chemotaxis protein methyltransferase CheR
MSPMPENDSSLSRFKELILNTCGFTLEMGREQTLIAALRQRMAARGVAEADAYHALLLRESGELNSLVELLTVNETYFFREPDHLNLAVDKLLPEFLNRRDNRQVRIVSAGCSTGEEAYSLAIMLRERYGADSARLFAITGVDIDSVAIAAAARGVYGKASFRGIDQGVLQRHFEAAGSAEYRIADELRKAVRFEVANLLGPTYPSGMQQADMIFYRNVSIYFPQDVQQKIFANLAGLLSQGGYLMVGAAETIHHNTGILSLVERGSLFLYRKSPLPSFEERRGPRRAEQLVIPPKASAAAPLERAPLRPRPEPKSQVRPSAPSRPERPVQQVGAVAFDTALGLARTGQTEKALELVEEIIERQPDLHKACALKGSLLLHAARYDEAAAVCREILSRDPLCLEACLMLGMIARQQGEDEIAFGRFREAVYLDASCWLAHFYSAELLFAKGDGKRARTGYQTASRLLEKGAPDEHGQAIFQLSFNAEQFIVICRHKLSLLKENG